MKAYALGSFAAASSEAYVVGYLMPLALRWLLVRTVWYMLTKKVDVAARRT